jgi:hypothetical protein
MNLTAKDYERIAARITEMKEEIPRKAGTDPEFHDALKANPQATIEKYYGFPEGMLKEIDIQIFQEEPGSIGLVIPPPPSTDGEELTEEQLEAVAGGAAFVGATAKTVAVLKIGAKIAGGGAVSYGAGRALQGWA